MRISFHNLGCKVNSYETESMQQLMAAEGFEIVPFEEPADVCVINTCSVTNIADRKSRQMIHKARKLNPDAIIVAAGCYAQMFAEDLEKEGCADIILGNNNKKDIVRLVKEYMGVTVPLSHVSDISRGCEYEPLSISSTADKTRAFIKIEDGCNNFCSYCIIPYARGRVRSRAIEDIIDEATRLSKDGFKEIVLTGINLSAYGSDGFVTSHSLIDILEKLNGIEGIERLRLSSLEPVIITEDFLKGIKALPKVCPHFHLSLQSGCDSVLSRMNRKYTTAEYYEKCCMIREYYDHPAITTDIITGFPGETEEEFQTTVDFVKRCDIYEAHIFKYSRRKGTAADRMEGQLTDAVKSERSSRLAKVAADNKKSFMESYKGRQVKVLAEEKVNIEGRKYYTGLTPEYVRSAFPAGGEDMTNRIVSGTVKDFLTDGLLYFFPD